MTWSRIYSTSRSTEGRLTERVLVMVLWAFALLASVIVAVIIFVLIIEAMPALVRIAPERFFTDRGWYPAHDRFNLAPMVIGTFLVAGGGVLLGTAFGLMSAVFCCYYSRPPISTLYEGLIELLAGIPSVVLGFWGMVELIPLIAAIHEPGPSVLAATLVLGLMVLPTISLLSIVSLRAVPSTLWLGAQALGFSKWSMITKVMMPAARRGLTSAVILGTCRAVGETMGVLMVSGNIVQVPRSIFAPIRTLAANIALEIPYAEGLHRSSLFVSGLLLTVLILVLLFLVDCISPEQNYE